MSRRSSADDGRTRPARPRPPAGPRTTCSTPTPGTSGARTCPSGRGARCARTTATSGDAWGYFPHDHARSRAYRWNEDGMAGISDVHHDLCLALALWNGRDPILKERMFGLTGPAGQPRRGRQGVLVVPRRPAQPRAAALALPLPAGRVPVRAAGRGERPPGPRRPRVRAARHRRVRRRPLLGRRRHLRQGLAHRRAARASRSRTTGPTRRRSTCCPTLWFRNTWRWAGRGAARRCASTATPSVVDHPRLAGYRLRGRRRPRTAPPRRRCSATTRPTRPASSAPTPITPYPEGRDQRPRRRRGGRRSTRRPARHQGGVVVPRSRARRRPRRAAAPPAPAPSRPRPHRRGERPGRRSTRWSAPARPRPTSSTPRSRRRTSTPSGCASCARRAPGWSGASRCTRTGSSRWLDGDPGEPPPPARPPRRPQRRLAPPRRLRRAGHARPLGVPVVRRLGPRVPRHRRGPTSTRPSPSTSCWCCCASGSMHPNGALPAYEWSFDDVNPPVHALAAHPGVPDRRRPATSSSSSGSSRSCCSTSPGGSTARTPTATTCSAAASSASTTSARSTGRTCRRGAARAGRRHGVDGVLLAGDAVHRRRRWPSDDHVYDDMVVKFLEQFVLIMDALERVGPATTPTTASSTTGSPTPHGTARRSGCRPWSAPIPALPGRHRPARPGPRSPALAQAVRPAGSSRRPGRGPTTGASAARSATTACCCCRSCRPTSCAGSSATLFDEDGFLSPHGLRSLSKRHETPYDGPRRARRDDRLRAGRVADRHVRRQLQLARARSGSRSTTWSIRALLQYDQFLGDDFTVEYPTGSGTELTLRRDRRRPRRPAASASGCPTPTAAGPSTAGWSCCRTTRPGGTTCCSSSTSTATTAPASARPTRPAGPPWSST